MKPSSSLDWVVKQRHFAFVYACGCSALAIALLIASAFGVERVSFAAGLMLGLVFQGFGAHMLLGQIATLRTAIEMRRIMRSARTAGETIHLMPEDALAVRSTGGELVAEFVAKTFCTLERTR